MAGRSARAGHRQAGSDNTEFSDSTPARPLGVKHFALQTDLWIKALLRVQQSSLGLGIPGLWELVAW